MLRQPLVAVLISLLLPLAAAAQTSRTPQVIQAVLREPIPTKALDRAREADDQIMQQGMVGDTRVYLVTDVRLQHVNEIVNRLLTAMGQERGQWQVRVLDTKPAVSNAFVTGGRYIYVFTGFLAEAQSDDEIALVLGHEIGHSMLKHILREEEDPWAQLAKIVTVIGAAKGSGSTWSAIGAGLQATHSQADELEADAIGTAIAWRAGYNAIRGANFFTRAVRASDDMWADASAQLKTMEADALQARTKCTQLVGSWKAGQIEQSTNNQNVVNSTCADAERKRLAYNNFNSQYAISQSQDQLNKLTSTHPEPQARISAIASGLDALEDRRDVSSIKIYPNLYNVLMGLYLEKSILLERPLAVAAAATSNAVADSRGTGTASLKLRLEQLKEAFEAGLITPTEYEAQRKEILGHL